MLEFTMEKRALKNIGEGRYRPPREIRTAALSELLASAGRAQLKDKQLDFLRQSDQVGTPRDVTLYFSGDLSLIDRPCVAIVGSRSVRVLIDDVATSGGHMKAAKRKLEDRHYDVRCGIVCARTAYDYGEDPWKAGEYELSPDLFNLF
jgi:hypothetical protein